VWELPELTKFIASANFYYGDKNIPSSGYSSSVGKQQDLSTRGNVKLDMPQAFRDDLAAEVSLDWHFYRRDYTSPAGALSRHDQQNISAINRWNWYPGELLVLRSGLDYYFAYLDSTDIGNRNRHSGGVFFTAEYKPWDTFLIIPSIKAALSTGSQGGITPVPKLGFLWNVNDSLSVKNNYFRSFKYPDFQDLYWAEGASTEGNPDLRPEDGWGGDLGLSWRYSDLFTLDSTFFTHWLKESIHWYPDSGGIWRPENVGEAVFFGLENRLGFDIPVSLGPVKKIIPSVTYQYLLSYLLSFGYDFASDKRIPYNPMHTIGASLEVPWETGSFLISGQYESLRFQDRSNRVELKPHFLLNAALNQKIGKHFTVFGVVRNILNTSYQSFYDYPMPGITLTLGLRMQYEANQRF
jgi:vitamin B12 transporter